jgi:hypothetical protein
VLFAATGAGIAGIDVLGYHSYSAAATWRVDTPPHRGGEASALDWTLSYSYDRWIPTLFASASWETQFAGVAVSGVPDPMVIPVRSRELEAGVLLEVAGTASGTNLFAMNKLSTSGSLMPA